MKYKLLVNGVDYENFKTIKDLDTYCFEHNINYDNPNIYNIEIKKIK